MHHLIIAYYQDLDARFYFTYQILKLGKNDCAAASDVNGILPLPISST